MGWQKRIAVVFTLAALFTAVSVAPAAGRPIEDYGATFSCRYRTIEGTEPTMGDLARIVVKAPIVFGEDYEQTVGWRLIVRRWLDDFETGQFKMTTWKSKIKTAVSYEGVQADLPKIIYYPPNLDPQARWDDSYFSAAIRIYWYASDGSVQRSLFHEMGSTFTYVDGELWYGGQVWDGSCSQPKQLDIIN